MTLALLLTAVGGAWAADPNTVIWNGNETTWKGWTDSETTHTVGDITITCSGNAKAYEHKYYSGRPLVMVAGTTDAITFTSNGAPFTSIKIKMYDGTDPGLAGWTWDNGYNVEWSGTPSTSVTLSGCDIKADVITFTFGTAEPPIVVEPGEAANTWTFNQPGSDVVLTPIYAKAAAFATTGTEPDVKTLLPEAAEGVIAGTDASLIAEGTGIVAFAGTSTEVTQGTVMYAIGTSATEAPAPEAFSATVPTAENVADDGADVYVWYYIQGADTPDGQQATEENTFNDSEICAEPLKVTVLTNKFDLTFNAANANTIEAGKATVTVGGTAATVTDGKLQGVKMGSEVKLNAKQGYKFRKVEVKKKGEVLTITVAKGSTDLSGDKLLYYTPGETYRQAIANHPENKLDGGLGWNIWEGGNDATIFYKESADKSRDLSIDGDQHFRPTDSINLDTVIDPTLNFYFVAQF